MKVDTIVHGGVVVTMDAARRVIEDGAVAVADGRIVAVGPSVEVLSSHAGERLDAAGQAILPGLIDVHAHAGHGLVKSMGMDEPGRWEAICGEVYTTASTTGFWYAEARLAALERLRFGVTTGVSLLGGGDTIMRIDDPKYADAHCRGVAEVRTRSVVAIGPTRAPHPRAYADPDSGGAPYPVTFERQMETCARVIDDWHGRDGIDIALLYPVLRDEHERDMAPEDYAEACRQTVAVRSLSRERGLIFTQDGHWRGSVRRADALGLLGTDALLSHCIELHEDEIAALGRWSAPRFDRTVRHDHGRLKSMLEDMLMPNDDIRRVEVITGIAGRRYWPAHEKLRIIEESLVPGESVSAVARRNGVAPNLLFRWRRLMDEGGAMAVGSNEPVVGASEVRKLEDRVRDLERLLGRKTMENEILKEALVKTGAKKQTWHLPSPLTGGSR